MRIKNLPIYEEDRARLDRFDEIWTGWEIHGPELVSPERWRFTPPRILAGHLRQQEIAALRVELRTARRRAPAYSPRLAQWHTLRAALQHLEDDIRSNGAMDELTELRNASED